MLGPCVKVVLSSDRRFQVVKTNTQTLILPISSLTVGSRLYAWQVNFPENSKAQLALCNVTPFIPVYYTFMYHSWFVV